MSWYLLLHKPITQQQQRYEAEMVHCQNRIKEIKHIHHLTTSTEQALALLQTEYAAYAAQSIKNVLLMIMQDAQKAGLVVTSCTHNKISKKYTWYQVDALVLQAEGDANKIQNYLQALRGRPMLLCNNFTLQSHTHDHYKMSCHLEMITAISQK